MSYIKWEMPTDDGLREACRIVNQGYLAECIGVKQTIISISISHKPKNGKPYYLPSDKVEVANRAIQRCAKELRQVRFSTEPLSEDECPYSYGDTPADQMRVFRERFKTRYILFDSMGWTDNKVKMYFNSKTHPYYNKVSQDDLALINRMVQMAADDLERIVLLADAEEPEKTAPTPLTDGDNPLAQAVRSDDPEVRRTALEAIDELRQDDDLRGWSEEELDYYEVMLLAESEN